MVTRLLQIFFSKFEFLRLDPNHPIRGLDVAEENSFPYFVLPEIKKTPFVVLQKKNLCDENNCSLRGGSVPGNQRNRRN